MPQLSQAQVRAAYDLIVSQDKTFLELFAKAAIENSAEVQADLFADYTDIPAPGADHIRNSAEAFTADMLKDFGDDLSKTIKEIKFKTNHRLTIRTNFED